MFSRASVITPKCQQGLALLVLVIFIVLAFTSYIFSELTISQIKVNTDKNTQLNLKKAKQAVIDYAVTYADRSAGNGYGVLPYPEAFLNGDDGKTATVVAGSTKNTNVVEWLPWRSLDLANLKDDSGTCLFYAVSGTYKLGASVQADMINEDSIGMFRVLNSANMVVQGGSDDSQVVALVIAPGAPLPGQVRNPAVVNSSCGRDYGNVSAYLEGNGVYNNSTTSATIDTVDDFIHATETSSTEATPYNDKFLTIAREEIWNAIVKRDDFKQKMENLVQGLAMCLAEYANMPDNTSRRLPWPVITNMGIMTSYRNNNNYTDDNGAANGYSGRYPFNVDDSNTVINIPIGVGDNLFDIIVDPVPLPPITLCENLDLSGTGAGPFIDLNTSTSEYRKLWNNWKDHFFYVLSKEYEPDNTGAGKCTGMAPCIQVNGTKYAAAVIFSGSRLPGATRNDKSDVAEYLEDGKAAVFINENTNKTGDRNYIYTDPQTDTENDIMYCIENKNNTADDLAVVECS